MTDHELDAELFKQERRGKPQVMVETAKLREILDRLATLEAAVAVVDTSIRQRRVGGGC